MKAAVHKVPCSKAPLLALLPVRSELQLRVSGGATKQSSTRTRGVAAQARRSGAEACLQTQLQVAASVLDWHRHNALRSSKPPVGWAVRALRGGCAVHKRHPQGAGHAGHNYARSAKLAGARNCKIGVRARCGPERLRKRLLMHPDAARRLLDRT